MRQAAAAAAAALALTACGDAANGDGSGTLTVFAAASLRDVFDDLAAELEDRRPGLDVRVSYGGSDGLAQAIVQGAPADVFASANEQQMDVVVDAGSAASPEVFASNVLQIAVPAGNPGGVTGLADLARGDLTVALCAPEVPCGAAARQVLAAAGVRAAPDSLEQDVRAALTKVALGEVDAALVYASDVRSARGDVEGIAVPEAGNAPNRYPIAVLTDAPGPQAARAFVDLVRSDQGQRALADAGFGAP